LGAFCLQFVDVSLNFDTLKFNWVTKIGIFRISGINLSHLGADFSILGAKKRFRGVKFANLGILFWGANLGILPILKAVKRPQEHVMERPAFILKFDNTYHIIKLWLIILLYFLAHD
jgi:hypothetical protein